MATLESIVTTNLAAESPAVSAAIERDGRRLLKLLAIRNGRSLSAEVRVALREHLARAISSGTLPTKT